MADPYRMETWHHLHTSSYTSFVPVWLTCKAQALMVYFVVHCEMGFFPWHDVLALLAFFSFLSCLQSTVIVDYIKSLSILKTRTSWFLAILILSPYIYLIFVHLKNAHIYTALVKSWMCVNLCTQELLASSSRSWEPPLTFCLHV